jgi:hypothetical protein
MAGFEVGMVYAVRVSVSHLENESLAKRFSIFA